MVTLLLLLVAITFSQSEIIEEKTHEMLLFDTIFKGYDKRIRPVIDYHKPVEVNLSIVYNQILHVDEKHQVITSNVLRIIHWKDDFLKWKPENFGNITQISTLPSTIWSPDILLYNSAEFGEENNADSSVRNVVIFNGTVVYAQPMILKSTCKIDVTWFPFDEQKCFLIFGSWTSPLKYLSFRVNEFDVDIGGFIDNGEWKLLEVSSMSKYEFYPCCPDEPYVRITYTIRMKRRPFYYFFNLLIPCGLIGFLATLGFTLPPESGEKLSLGASILFSLIVFLNMISESMPANSDAVPLLGTYFNCVMFTIALSVVSTIVVNLNLKTAHPKELQGLSKKVFLYWLPRILHLNPSPNIICRDKVLCLCNKRKIEDTITLHLNQSSGSTDSERIIVIDQWKFVAAVVDRMCLVFSLMFTFISVTVFLVYAF